MSHRRKKTCGCWKCCKDEHCCNSTTQL